MKVIIICNLQIEDLPPVVSTITALEKNGCQVVLVTPFLSNTYKTMFNELKFYDLYKTKEEYNIFKKKNILLQNIHMYTKWNNFIFKILEREYDNNSFVWILHEHTASRLSKKISKYKYAITIYEMKKNPKNMKILPSNVKKITQNASLVITPEYNRSHILKCWWNLKEVPIVLPNKPFIDKKKLIEDDSIRKIKQQINHFKKDKKILLYQGSLGADRNLEPFIEAVATKSNYKIILMGACNDFIKEVANKYPDSCMIINSIAAPKHLLITQCADIGIVSYIDSSKSYYDPLNIVYCAPNKIYEYSMNSIPMICSNQPGLHYSVELNHAGLCIDINNVNEIREALNTIEKNEQFFKQGSKKLYDSVDIQNIVNEIVSKMGEFK